MVATNVQNYMGTYICVCVFVLNFSGYVVHVICAPTNISICINIIKCTCLHFQQGGI